MPRIRGISLDNPEQSHNKKLEIPSCVVEIHKNAGGLFVKSAQGQMQFGRKSAQFAQIDAKGEKVMLNFCT